MAITTRSKQMKQYKPLSKEEKEAMKREDKMTKDFEKASRHMIKFLNDYWHPHAKD